MARPSQITALQVLPSNRTAYSLDATWLPNRNEDLPVIRYELQYIDESLETSDWIPVGTRTSHNLQGLVPNVRYGVRVRAVNSDDNGFPSEYKYSTPRFIHIIYVGGDNVGVNLNSDATIYNLTNLGGVDVMLRFHWNASDLYWYFDIEWPVNTATIAGVAIKTFADLVPAGVIPGQFNCYPASVDQGLNDPGKNAWVDKTHFLFWSPARN